MEPTITGAEAAERAAEYLELKGTANTARGQAWATLALALATAGEWTDTTGAEYEPLFDPPAQCQETSRGHRCTLFEAHPTTWHRDGTYLWHDAEPADPSWKVCPASCGPHLCNLIEGHGHTWHRNGDACWPAQDNPVCELEDGHGGPCLPREGCVRVDLSGDIPEQDTNRDT